MKLNKLVEILAFDARLRVLEKKLERVDSNMLCVMHTVMKRTQ